MNMLLRLHSLVRCVRVKSSFLQCSIESTLNLENMHFQFLMEVSSSMEFLGHPLSLDRSMSGNGSWWSQFYNGWTSSMMSPHHSMEFDKSERLKSMDVWFSCFWDLVERKLHLPLLFCQEHQTRKEQEEVVLPLSVCWKPATFHALHLPNPEACTASPKEMLKESSQVHGDSKAKGRAEVLSMPISVQYCTQASADAYQMQKKYIFLSLLKSIWLSYCFH